MAQECGVGINDVDADVITLLTFIMFFNSIFFNYYLICMGVVFMFFLKNVTCVCVRGRD